ncbi:trifunctional purine biosynthetic protein adenosine-3 [Ostrinia nubilalis]|uniref:trifunctional purine biosynthetic protein adenosine-3 n=1 Tax=Ostrinia nubilalis TaxID=29057 RepID=UPI0030824398
MSEANVLVIGSGGREHALCWKLADSPFVKRIYCAPGSVGISTTNKVESVDLDINDYPGLAKWCKEQSIELVVVGPEDPLANGIVDELTALGIPCFGPTKAGAEIEANKDWSKKFMNKYQIPTARHKSFTDAAAAKEFINSAPYPALVVKASGLAAGKGVVVAASKEEACEAVDDILTDSKFGVAGQTVVIEELLDGDEVSVLAFTDGETVSMMPPAQDHKRIGDGDVGPNTGGMGAYCPCPLITPDQLADVKDQVLQRAVDGLKAEGIKYVGVLYAGMMVTKSGPMTLEFNCRFGDPETQVLVTLLESDLYTVMKACVTGTLNKHQLMWNTKLSAVGVVLASKGYPETSTKGCVISGLSQVQATPGLVVFHSGVARGANGSLVTWGGRVLLVCARAASLRAAAAAATAAASVIDFPGAQYRKDIAHRAFSKLNGLSYLQSGVDIDAAATLVRQIEPLATATHRRGVLGRLGCFSGLFQLSAMDPTLKDPVLVQGTDGVGTKVKIAEIMNKYDTIGQDLVAMCVNDILCAGAEPFAFLDYMACGRLQVELASSIVKGIADACILSGCALLGGETAEMPSMYDVGKYDLAGFAVGVVDNLKQLPRIKEIRAGDVVLALPSTGVHSNGYSLVQKIMAESGCRYNQTIARVTPSTSYNIKQLPRIKEIGAVDVVLALPSTGVHSNGYSLVQKIMAESGCRYTEKAPFSTAGRTFGEEFLEPTGIYVRQVLPALRRSLVKALAHITGGGLLDNVPRVLPPGLRVRLDASKFQIKPLFGWLQAKEEHRRSSKEALRRSLLKALAHITGGGLLDNVPRVLPPGLRVRLDASKFQIKPLFGWLQAKDYVYVRQVLPALRRSLVKALAHITGGGLLDNVPRVLPPGLRVRLDASKFQIKPLFGWLQAKDYVYVRQVLPALRRSLVKALAHITGGGLLDNVPRVLPPGLRVRLDASKFQIKPLFGWLQAKGLLDNVPRVLPPGLRVRLDASKFQIKPLFGWLQAKEEHRRSSKEALRRSLVKALAHITGGGLLDNVPRVLPPGLRVRLDASKFQIKPLFGWLQAKGMVSDFEMLRTFNCGVGMVLIVDPVVVKELLGLVEGDIRVVGTVEAIGKEGGHQVAVDNFREAMAPLTAPYVIGQAVRQKSLSYKDSGVDIEAGDSLVSLIKPLARSTSRSGVLGGLGGFGGCFQLKAIEQEFKDPVLVLAADGVGTKLKIAQTINQHSTIGIDLVAMCINDILCNGATPLTFLDYFACGSLDVNVARNVVSGVAEGCRQANAALIGGETAEMPGMYEPGAYDIAGFALGVVERTQVLPKINDITVGDIIIGLPSNGVHSNGFSLIHKLMKKTGLTLQDKAPFSKEGLTLGEELIKPTRIYARAMAAALASGRVKAAAHVTGGGLPDNLPRVVPASVRARLDAHCWHVPPVFAWIADAAAVSDDEMLRTFNCGIGMVLIVSPEDQAEVMNTTRSYGAMVIGSIQARPPGGARVVIDNFASSLDFTRRMPLLPSRKNTDRLELIPFRVDKCATSFSLHCTTRSYGAMVIGSIQARPPGGARVVIDNFASSLDFTRRMPLLPSRKVAVLVSGNGSNLQALIETTRDPSQCMCADVTLVVSNRPGVRALERAEAAGIPALVFNHKEYSSREEFDRAVSAALESHKIDIVCLAGYMRILSAEFVQKWKGRLINIHPSLLPRHPGLHAQQQCLDAGDRETGCTVHFVDEGMDTGPIITQERVPVLRDDDADTLAARIHLAEHRAFPRALRLLATGRVRLTQRGTVAWHS